MERIITRTRRSSLPLTCFEAREGYTIDIFNFSKSSMFMDPEDAKSGDHIRNGIFGTYPKVADTGVDAVTDVKEFILKYFGAYR